MEKATLVSILPIPLNESIAGYIPGRFYVPESKENEPELLAIGPSDYLEYIDSDRGSRRFRVQADKVAEELTNSFNRASIGFEPGSKSPGFFWVPGDVGLNELNDEHEEILDRFRVMQVNWFKTLVELADDLWQRYKQHGAIPEICRRAAKAMAMERPWNMDVHREQLIRCPACMTFVSSLAVVCANCQCVIDTKRFKTMLEEGRFIGKTA